MNSSNTLFPEFPLPGQQADLFESLEVELAARVVLYNDEIHTFDEVIEQIIKATGCSGARAEELTLEVHHSGKAIVFDGDVGSCLRVSNVLEEIGLHTQIIC